MYRSLLHAQTVINRLETLVTEDLGSGASAPNTINFDHPGVALVPPPSARTGNALRSIDQ